VTGSGTTDHSWGLDKALDEATALRAALDFIDRQHTATIPPISRGGPVVVSVPPLRQPRYYIVQILEMFDEVV